MNNGTRKGGQPDAMRIIYSSPGLEDLWQIHFSLLSGQEYTVPGMFIANLTDEPASASRWPRCGSAPGPNAPPPPAHNGPAYWIKVSAQPDGTFTVTNGGTDSARPTRRADEVVSRSRWHEGVRALTNVSGAWPPSAARDCG